MRDAVRAPAHPYTLGLLDSMPRLQGGASDGCRPSPAPCRARCSGRPAAAFARRAARRRPDRCARAVPAGSTERRRPWPSPAGAPLAMSGRGDATMTERRRPLAARFAALSKHFPVKRGGRVHAVNGVSFEHRRGETLGLVGESGCGKSTLGPRGCSGLIEPTAGRVVLRGPATSGALSARGAAPAPARLQIVFQDPYASLEPAHDGRRDRSAEPLHHSRPGRPPRAARRGRRLLERVGLPAEARRPLSARVLRRPAPADRHRPGARPAARAASSATSRSRRSTSRSRRRSSTCCVELQRELGLTYLFIAHDLAVVRHISDRVAVMYLGQIVELGAGRPLSTSAPPHPYTEALLSAIPQPDPERRRAADRARRAMSRTPITPPPGCPFHPRCP